MAVNRGKLVQDWVAPEVGMNARYIIIGEAPGAEEVKQNKPFVGSSGYLLQQWYEAAGFTREHFYFTNVYPYQPPGNKIAKIPQEELDYWIGRLLQKIAEFPDLWMLIPVGATAFQALRGTRKDSIMDWRGSILEYQDESGRHIKMIPVIHPAAVLRSKSLELRCRWDWYRIAQEAHTREVSLPQRNHRINPTVQDCREYLQNLNPSLPLAVDIETHPEQGITCIGFAQSPTESFTIPLGVQRRLEKKARLTAEQKEERISKCNSRIHNSVFSADAPLEGMVTKRAEENAIEKWKQDRKPLKRIRKLVEEWERIHGVESPERWPDEEPAFMTVGYWKTEEENEEALKVVKAICESEIHKILQTGFYDMYWLADYGIDLHGYMWDTACMHHVLMAREEHKLSFLASLYTREPFWKHEAKEGATSGQYISNKDALYTYNGKDCCLTYEIFTVFYQQLKEQGKLEFFDRHYRKLWPALFSMMRTGLKVDVEKMKEKKKEYQQELTKLLQEVDELAGVKLSTAKTISAQKLTKYLYEDLKLPRQKRKRADGERSDSADEVAIRKLMLRCPEKMGKLGHKILRVRRLTKLIGTYLQEVKVDKDGRFRSQYKMLTNSGRLSSSENPRKTGGNAQNIDAEIRDLFIAG